MPLDDLVGAIETLQRRIRQHGPSLRENEIRTQSGDATAVVNNDRILLQHYNVNPANVFVQTGP